MENSSSPLPHPLPLIHHIKHARSLGIFLLAGTSGLPTVGGWSMDNTWGILAKMVIEQTGF